MADTTDGGARKAGSHERVRAFLAGHGLADDVLHFDDRSTKTCQLAADAVGCELGQIVKSLVFVADATPVLALVAGDRRGDTGAVRTRSASPTPTPFAPRPATPSAASPRSTCPRA
jgi:prolyl-tRNA editing enzyme YbaK/EbsC (Cys-tRNA(Pro) deacylase)